MKTLPGMVLAFTAFVMCPCARAAEPSPSPYPLSTCIVSDEKLGEMGKPSMIEHQGRQIGFCCDSCIPKFLKDPAKYLAKLPAPAKP